MKKMTGFVALLLFTSGVWARPAGHQAALAARLETQVQSAVQAAAPTARFEALLDNFSAQETQDIMSVIKELRVAKEFIQQHLKFPANLQDRKQAGVLFGRLMPVMKQYEHLRKQNVRAAQVAGLAIVQEEFVSQDGHKFYVPAFIKQYVELLQNPSFPKNYREPLIEEFNTFREHILQDQAALE